MLWSLLDKLTLFQSPTIELVLPALRPLSPEESTAFAVSEFGELRVHVHRNLLADASPALRKALFTDAPVNSLVLCDVDNWTLQRFLEWLYRGAYTPPSTTPHNTLLTITQKLAHARILVLATRFNIVSLQASARLHFRSIDWPVRTVSQWPTERCKAIVHLIRYCFENIGTEFLSKRKRSPLPELNVNNAEAFMEELVMDLKRNWVAFQLDRGCGDEPTGWQELCEMNKFTRAMFLVPLRASNRKGRKTRET
ncbi:hypothetical protein L211DRAFT_869411 [Terfezia boudieri ATCC MYA-4762]|uniref:BTB domain-containing protein n=1 Tax=Terfezia boudieri ATCC MYA-4762 TaxID=1051890 RepID=A0A3N4LLG8_9PEZI|nr:hypothetical protein L211DRAFT_869411 [Terfezia boudieri ATCC MYA-4762]